MVRKAPDDIRGDIAKSIDKLGSNGADNVKLHLLRADLPHDWGDVSRELMDMRREGLVSLSNLDNPRDIREVQGGGGEIAHANGQKFHIAHMEPGARAAPPPPPASAPRPLPPAAPSTPQRGSSPLDDLMRQMRGPAELAAPSPGVSKDTEFTSSMRRLLGLKDDDGVLGMTRPTGGARPGFDPATGSAPAPGTPAAAPRTPFQTHMHALADTLDGIAKNKTFGELPSGLHPAAYERQRALLGAVKDVAKGIDKVFAEIHRVAGDPDIDYDAPVWEDVKNGLHDSIRETATEMRSEMRSDPDLVGEDAGRPHVDLTQMAGEIAKEVRGVADTNAWIERARGDDQALHPDDLDHLADQVQGMSARFDDFFNEIETSSWADYRRVSRDSEERELHRIESNHIDAAQTLAEDLRNSAAEMRESMGDDVAPRATAPRAAPQGAATRPDLTLRNGRTGETAQAQSVTSLKDALKQFDVSHDAGADMLQRASHLAIGDRLGKLVGHVPVYTVGPAEMRTLAQGRVNIQSGHEPAGFYDPKAGHIVALDDVMKNPAEASRLMLHEGAHAALMRTINESDSARNVIDHLRTVAAETHAARGDATTHYGLTNAHEFISEAFANPEFQRFLSTIAATKEQVRAFGLQSIRGASLWDALTGAVRKILGLAPDQHTLLDATMKLGGHLLDHAESRAPGRQAEPRAASP